MSLPEARRHDLYNALEEALGTERADTLMAYLPIDEAGTLATRDDVAVVAGNVGGLGPELKGEIQDLRTELKGEIQDLRTELKGEIQVLRTELKGEIQVLRTELRDEIRSVNQRLDTLFLTLAAGLIAIVGAIVTAFFIG
jgi:hypothetical protein